MSLSKKYYGAEGQAERQAERKAYSEYIAERFPLVSGGYPRASAFNQSAMDANLAARVDFIRGRSEEPAPCVPVAHAPLPDAP